MIFESVLIKFGYFFRFVKSSLSSNNLPIKQARNLSKFAQSDFFDLIKQGERSDLKVNHFFQFFYLIFERFFAVISFHESITYLCLAKHGLNAMLNLRSQLESMLIIFYFIQPKDNISEIEKRVESYSEWIKIKLYQNFNKSKTLSYLSDIDMSKYESQISHDYFDLEEKYKNDPKGFKSLKNSPSFLHNKFKLAEDFGVSDLYDHIFSESSASIHCADNNDRLKFVSGLNCFEYYVRDFDGFWPLVLSNVLLYKTMLTLADFFEASKSIKTKLDVFFSV